MRHKPYRPLKQMSLVAPVHQLPKVQGPKKAQYRLREGPWDGQKVWLADGTTARLCVRVPPTPGPGGTLHGGGLYRGLYRCAVVGKPGHFSGVAQWHGEFVA